MTIYVAVYQDWDGIQEYVLFATEELAQQYIDRQERRKDNWFINEEEVGGL